jgi:hypothetical protein
MLKMKQAKLFPRWKDGLKSADLERQAVEMAKTPAKATTAKNGQLRPVVDVNKNGIKTPLIVG